MRSASLLFALLLALSASAAVEGLMPYMPRSLLDMMVEDPFRILEQARLAVPTPGAASEVLALARADWKETPEAHVISLDVPGVRKEDIKIEVEENRLVRISGERRAEEAAEGDRWHRAERAAGRFWRQFRLPASSDVDAIKAQLEGGVLRVTVPKLAEERRRQPRTVGIVEGEGSGKLNRGEDIKATRAEM